MRGSTHPTRLREGREPRDTAYGRASDAGAGAATEGRGGGRRAVRPLQPRPLRDRCVALSDDAGWSGGAARAIAVARAEGVTVLPRGGGTSQAGQTVNASLVIDCSKHLTRILELDIPGRRCVVEPGIVLDDLNRALKAHGLWFPVDVSTAYRATT